MGGLGCALDLVPWVREWSCPGVDEGIDLAPGNEAALVSWGSGEGLLVSLELLLLSSNGGCGRGWIGLGGARAVGKGNVHETTGQEGPLS